MNREQAAQVWPLVKAYGEGKALQYRAKFIEYGEGEGWSDMPVHEERCMQFPREDYEYRIKPEPREFWIEPSIGAVQRTTEGHGYEKDSGWVKVREVTDD